MTGIAPSLAAFVQRPVVAVPAASDLRRDRIGGVPIVDRPQPDWRVDQCFEGLASDRDPSIIHPNCTVEAAEMN